jgi:hypothetical protein
MHICPSTKNEVSRFEIDLILSMQWQNTSKEIHQIYVT